ncbi:MAG: BrnT family toxin [Bacteroidetes bacterium]|nr:BrnT family toxin [Bacteroidota bacterium]MBU1680552.1 BrnT family toxin [Bacteroidota bacterium]MBU2508423.1 BrnT family toxin [Bacteroidota bacterium]
MESISFQWDQRKNLANIKKHRISFEEAKTVFYDENARVIPDPEHSANEDRFIILGFSSNLKLLIVVHTYKENDEVIRIISVRKATKSESKYYNEAK